MFFQLHVKTLFAISVCYENGAENMCLRRDDTDKNVVMMPGMKYWFIDTDNSCCQYEHFVDINIFEKEYMIDYFIQMVGLRSNRLFMEMKIAYDYFNVFNIENDVFGLTFPKFKIIHGYGKEKMCNFAHYVFNNIEMLDEIVENINKDYLNENKEVIYKKGQRKFTFEKWIFERKFKDNEYLCLCFFNRKTKEVYRAVLYFEKGASKDTPLECFTVELKDEFHLKVFTKSSNNYLKLQSMKLYKYNDKITDDKNFYECVVPEATVTKMEKEVGRDWVKIALICCLSFAVLGVACVILLIYYKKRSLRKVKVVKETNEPSK